MKQFLRTLLQWLVIGVLLVAPLAIPTLWPWGAVLAWIVAGGLISYGLLHPDHAIRRALIGASALVLSAGAAQVTVDPLIGFLEGAGATPALLDAIRVGVAALTGTALTWQAVMVVAILAVVEAVRMICQAAGPFSKHETAGAEVRPARSLGTVLLFERDGRDRIHLEHAVTVTNGKGTTTVSVSGASMRFFRVIRLEAEVYRTTTMNPVPAALEPVTVAPGESVTLTLIVRTAPQAMRRLCRGLARTGLSVVVDIVGAATLSGHSGLPEKPTTLRYGIRRADAHEENL